MTPSSEMNSATIIFLMGTPVFSILIMLEPKYVKLLNDLIVEQHAATLFVEFGIHYS